MSRQTEVPAWVKERRQWHNENTRPQYFSIPEGETVIEVDVNQPPEKREGDFGPQYVYRVRMNGEQYLLSASVRLDRLIVLALSEGINPMTIIRTGMKKETRYSIKELAKKKR
jgi:hypothetical protein